MDLRFRRNVETGNLHVDGKAPCGAEFKDVAIVIDPRSEDPGLALDKPLGVSAVKAILDYVGRRKRRCEKLN
jgi:hypothetical protein